MLTYGGILRALRLDAGRKPVSLVLGLDDLPAYLADATHLGKLIGRCSGRIAHGRYEHDGRTYQLSANEGRHHLHGGYGGFGQRLWRVEEQDADRVRLACTLEDGEDGYPGRLDASVELRLQGTTLHLACTARCDAATPFDPTYHPYFNLAGDPAVPAAQQMLRVPADRYLPVDWELIPLGETANVEATPFDFRRPATPARNTDRSNPQIRMSKGYDHCLVLSDDTDCSAELYSSRQRRSDAPVQRCAGASVLRRAEPRHPASSSRPGRVPGTAGISRCAESPRFSRRDAAAGPTLCAPHRLPLRPHRAGQWMGTGHGGPGSRSSCRHGGGRNRRSLDPSDSEAHLQTLEAVSPPTATHFGHLVMQRSGTATPASECVRSREWRSNWLSVHSIIAAGAPQDCNAASSARCCGGAAHCHARMSGRDDLFSREPFSRDRKCECPRGLLARSSSF
jgi:aldose 1-epimerase